MKILFVDDEAPILRGIERMLDSTEDDWDADFVTSASDALNLMQDDDFDVIVSDMRMPRMDGAQLLQQVSAEWPRTVRIVLSGQASRDAVLRAVEPMHQYLSKPCDAETLRTTVLRACQLRDLLLSERLQQLVGSVRTLPSVPSLYSDVMKVIESPNGSAAAVGDIVMQDPGMTAKILQITNSAAFGLGNPVSSPTQSVALLGMDLIKSLVLSAGVFRQFDDARIPGFSIEKLINHCMKVAGIARRIIRKHRGDGKLVSEAFTAGMLHNVGKLIVATNSPGCWAKIHSLSLTDNISECEAERQVLGTDHAAIGAYLLSMWGLPQSLVEAIAFHRQPDLNDETELTSLTAVSAANLVVLKQAGEADEELQNSVQQHLVQLGMEDALERWQTLASVTDERELSPQEQVDGIDG